MATTLERLRVIIDGEIGPFKRKMQEATGTVKRSQNKINQATSGMQQVVRNRLGGISAAFTGLAKLAAFTYIGKKILDLGMYSTQMALQVTAAINQIKRQMGESSQSFLKWVEKNANAMNMSVSDATKYGAVYSNLFSNFIKDSEKLSAYTGKMLQTSAIIAQGSGRTMTDVMERIRSGLLGNTEAIEDLGINVNVAMIESTEAFKRFANGQSWRQLDFNTQQQIRLMAILEQATAKYGNTLQQSVNGRISLFKSLLADTALNIGNAMLPIINAMMPVLNSFAMVLKNVTAKLAEFIGLMFNKKASVKNSTVGNIAQDAQKTSDAVGGLGDAMDGIGDSSGGIADNLDDAAKSAKKAVKELLGLAGFDEITTLNKQDDSNDSGGKGEKGGGNSFNDILPEIALEDMDNQFKSIFDGWDKSLQPIWDYLSKLKDLFKDGFNMSFRTDSLDRFKNALAGIWQSLKDIFADGTILQSAKRFGEKVAFALGQGLGAIANVVMGIAVFIAESLNKSLNETKIDIKNWIIRQFEIKGDTITSVGNLAQSLGQIFYDTFTSAAATNIGADIISSLSYIYMGVEEINNKIERDFVAFWEQLAVDNQQGITTAFVGLLSAIEPIFESIKNLIKNTFEGFNQMYDEHLKPFFDSFTEGFSSIFGTLLDSWNNDVQPILDSIGQTFSDMFDNHIQPFIDNFLYAFGQILDLLKLIWEKVLVPFFDWLAANILPVLLPTLQMLAELFVTAWNVVFDVLGAVLKILGGIIEFLVGVFTGDWEKAWNGIVQVAKGIWDLLSSIFMFIWNSILSFLKGVWNTIVAILQAGWDGIVRIFQGLGKWFSEKWQEVINVFTKADTWFKEKFEKAYKYIQDSFRSIGNWFKERYNDITQAMGNIGRWFSDKFREAWNGITNAFRNVGGFFKGIFDSIVGWFTNIGVAVGNAVAGAFKSGINGAIATVENVVNGFIGLINGAIGLINKIPGVSIGRIGYVNLPRLARGGIVDSPTVAMIGEAGKEVVMPLENTGFLQTMGRVVGGAVVAALGGGVPQSPALPSGDIVIMIGSREFGRFAIDEINKAQSQAGELLLNI